MLLCNEGKMGFHGKGGCALHDLQKPAVWSQGTGERGPKGSSPAAQGQEDLREPRSSGETGLQARLSWEEFRVPCHHPFLRPCGSPQLG